MHARASRGAPGWQRAGRCGPGRRIALARRRSARRHGGRPRATPGRGVCGRRTASQAVLRGPRAIQTRRASGAPVAAGRPGAFCGRRRAFLIRKGVVTVAGRVVGLVAVDPLGGAQIRERLDRRRGRGQPVGPRGGQTIVSQHISGRLVVRAVGPVRGVRRGASVRPLAGVAARGFLGGQRWVRRYGRVPVLSKCRVPRLYSRVPQCVPRSAPRLRKSSGRRPGSLRGLPVRARPVGRGTGHRTGLIRPIVPGCRRPVGRRSLRVNRGEWIGPGWQVRLEVIVPTPADLLSRPC